MLNDTDRQALVAAQAIAEQYGLVLVDGRMVDQEGTVWADAMLAAVVAARLAAQTGAQEPRALTPRQTKALLGRLTRARAALGRTLLAGADVAYAEALRHAGVKISTRARRQSVGKQREVQKAVEDGQPLAPFMTQVGIAESDVLAGAFETYRTHALRAIEGWQGRQRQLVERAGLDPAVYLKLGDPSEAVEFIVAGLLALTRQTLVEGTVAPSMLAAVPRRVVPGKPRAVRAFEQSGEPSQVAARVKPTTPAILRPQARPARVAPGNRPRVPASLVRNAIKVADGKARAVHAESPDLMPTIAELPEGATAEDRLTGELVDGAPLMRWEHGFYGEPAVVFDEHDELDGLETRDTETDDRLINPFDWPPLPYYQPQDHDYCTCEWVPASAD